MNFPKLKRSDLLYSKNDPLLIPGLSLEKAYLRLLKRKIIYYILHTIVFLI